MGVYADSSDDFVNHRLRYLFIFSQNAEKAIQEGRKDSRL
jgi:hypothetical protein